MKTLLLCRSCPKGKSLILLLASIILFFFACKKVKQDNEFPDLPAYSETGSNSGGVFINDNVWLCWRPTFIPEIPALEIHSYPQGDSLILVLNGGYKKIPPYSLEEGLGPNAIFFVIKNIHITNDADLLKLNKKVILLDSTNNYAGLSYGGEKRGRGKGTLYMGEVKVNTHGNYGTKENPIHPYTVPGRFAFEINGAKTYVLKEGRFDGKQVNGINFKIVE
ncbi:hypothetical protein FW774_01555 (plasmid) [Pedobacter sp. BS3]|uniref:hypothetical protein n=1 Tax=Pedobacter sp. BS3 TaxID=2567937 RepID=UPI0011EBD9AC|nr:hypothetical protein [Pedobacter sp. BS3]TZF85784.1 hypothetical protein FW774_01555 [Pedobacter sp. BS3]